MNKMTPSQLREYIESMRLEHLRLKHDIEECEFQLDQNQCPECHRRLMEDLEIMMTIAEDTYDLPQALLNLEEHLAEDEVMNGWKGDDRVVEF
jgi:hypothetical protein